MLGRDHYGHIVKIYYFLEQSFSLVATVVAQLVRAFTSREESQKFETILQQTGSESSAAKYSTMEVNAVSNLFI